MTIQISSPKFVKLNISLWKRVSVIILKSPKMDIPPYFQKVKYIFWPEFFLKKANFPKYALVLVVTCRKLNSEKCTITPATPPPPTWGPIRGLKKLYPETQNHGRTHGRTDGHGNSMTELAPWGQFSEKSRSFFFKRYKTFLNRKN